MLNYSFIQSIRGWTGISDYGLCVFMNNTLRTHINIVVSNEPAAWGLSQRVTKSTTLCSISSTVVLFPLRTVILCVRPALSVGRPPEKITRLSLEIRTISIELRMTFKEVHLPWYKYLPDIKEAYVQKLFFQGFSPEGHLVQVSVLIILLNRNIFYNLIIDMRRQQYILSIYVYLCIQNKRRATHPVLEVFHSNRSIGLHGSGFPSLFAFAENTVIFITVNIEVCGLKCLLGTYNFSSHYLTIALTLLLLLLP